MVQHSGFLVGLPDEGERHELRRQVVRWLIAEPKIGRTFTFYFGVPTQLQRFPMLLNDIDKEGQFVFISLTGWFGRKQEKLRLTPQEFRRYQNEGMVFCGDWL